MAIAPSSTSDLPLPPTESQYLPINYGTFVRKPASRPQLGPSFLSWDNATGRIAEIASLPFLLMQVPQIILNTSNLLKGNYTAVAAVEWKAQLASLAGNLSLMSYFVHKRERGASIVQTVGVITTLVVLIQLTIADAMPLAVLIATATACMIGFTMNILHYVGYITAQIWKVWEEIIGVIGIYVLCQMIWSTFDLFLPSSIWPGIIAAAIDVALVILARLGKLPDAAMRMMGGVSGWTATLLFMWSPISQLYSNFLDPSNIEGLSVFTILLSLIGNGLLMSRALFIRDVMWFTGASWGCLVQGWTILLSMYLYQAISWWLFLIATCILICWLGFIFVKDQKAYVQRWPFSGLAEMFLGRRSLSILE